MRSLTSLPARLAAAALLLTGVGCHTVYATAPVGTQPADLDAEEWNGWWMHSEALVLLEVVEPGVLRMARVEEEDGALELVQDRLLMRRAGGWTIANLERVEDDWDAPRWAWWRVKVVEDDLYLWVPDVESFGEFVDDGLLPGRRAGKDVVLDALTDEQTQGLSTGALDVLFVGDGTPIVLRRLDTETP